MIYYVSYLKDRLGNNYLGINVPYEIVEPYLTKLEELIGKENYEIFTKNQQQRDHGNYHITVINVMDYNKLSKDIGIDKFINSLELVFDYVIDDLEMLGVGMATKVDNSAYFVVCQSDKLDAIRTRFGLGKQDFHITLGFNPKDVFGVSKNKTI